MAPKHGLTQQEEGVAKRTKSSETPASRSATPAEASVHVPFEVAYPIMNSKKQLSKKEQELVDNAESQESPFGAKGALRPGELDQHYAVKPAREWAAMKKYNNFIIQGEVYKNNQFVFVRGEDTPKVAENAEQAKNFWVARILQVRAQNAQHVYALVAWMYWPEELPRPAAKATDLVDKTSGKRNYHGERELVASNYMEVLDVLSFAGKAEVAHWLEEDDSSPHGLYWRQTFCRATQELSKVREHCVCGGHFNPEQAMYICDNSDCKVWLHKDCLLHDALMKANQESEETEASGSAKKNKKGKPYKGRFEGKILQDGEEAPKILIEDLRQGGRKTVSTDRIQCLKCGAELE